MKTRIIYSISHSSCQDLQQISVNDYGGMDFNPHIVTQNLKCVIIWFIICSKIL